MIWTVRLYLRRFARAGILLLWACLLLLQVSQPLAAAETSPRYRMEPAPNPVSILTSPRINNFQVIAQPKIANSDMGNYLGTEGPLTNPRNTPISSAIAFAVVNGARTNFVAPMGKPSFGTAISSEGQWFGGYFGLGDMSAVLFYIPTRAFIWNPEFGTQFIEAAVQPTSINGLPAFLASGGADRWLWEYGKLRALNEVFPSGGEWDLHYPTELNSQMEVVGFGYHQGSLRVFKASRQGIEDLMEGLGDVSINDLGTVLVKTGANAFLAKNGVITSLTAIVENLNGNTLSAFGNINNFDQVPAMASDGKTNRLVILSPAIFGSTVHPALTNDLFASSAPLRGLETGAAVNNLTATKDSGESNHAGDAGGASVWWNWTAPLSTNVTLTTAGSSIDTLLAAYASAGIGRLTLVASNDNYSAHHHFSQLEFAAEAGKTYFFAADGKAGARGHIVLRLTTKPGLQTKPPNNHPASATPLAANFEVAGSTVGATSEPAEPGDFKPNSVWFTWIAPDSKTATVRALKIPSSVPVKLHVYTGATNMTLVPSSEVWAPGNEWFRVTFAAIKGEKYYFGLSDGGPEPGFYSLSTVPANDNFSDAQPLSTEVEESFPYSFAAASVEPDEAIKLPDAARSLWWRYDAVRIENLGILAGHMDVFEGSSLKELQPITTSIGGGTVRFRTAPGHTYWIRLSTTQDTPGTGILSTHHFVPPPNDDYENAITIAPFEREVTIDADAAGATRQALEAGPENASRYSIWYKYTPLHDEAIRVPGFPLPYWGVQIGLNPTNDNFVWLTQALPYPLKAGVTYFIRVGGPEYVDPAEHPTPLHLEHGMRIGKITASYRNHFLLDLPATSASDFDFALEVSPDLRTWTPVRTNTTMTSYNYVYPSTWTFTNSAHLPQQFFRIREFPRAN